MGKAANDIQRSALGSLSFRDRPGEVENGPVLTLPILAVAVLAFWLCVLAPFARAQTPPAKPTAKPPGPVQVHAHAEPITVTIGQPFRYVVDITAPRDVELVVPVLGDRYGDFFVTDFGSTPPHAENGKVVTTRWFKMVTYSTGDKVIPGFAVKYRLPGEGLQEAQADDVLLIVDSLLAKDKSANDIRDIVPPQAVPWDWRPAAWVAAAVAAGLLLIAGLYLLINRRRAALQVKPPPPHEVALEALARLRARNLIEAGRREEYYVTLSGIIRAYVENRFGLRAPEMTTEEFLLAMQRDRRLIAEHRSLLSHFLTESDLVKFARHEPTTEDAERAYDAARRFVEESRLGPGPEEADRAAA